MKKITSFLLLCVSVVGFSQNFVGEFTPIEQTGLHQIVIAPNIRAVAKNDLRFLRIFDSKKQQVPYAFTTPNRESENYSQFTIVSKNSIADSITSLVVENKARKKINQFNLQIENTALTKIYSVSGSNNGEEWFGLVANEVLSDLVSNTGTSVTKTINFPSNTYSFLRIIFTDKKSLPINILSVGIAETVIIPEKLIEISDFKYEISEDKKRNITIITFNAPTAYEIDAIGFDIATDYYNRSARVVLRREALHRKRKTYYDEELVSFVLNSKGPKTQYFNSIDQREFKIEIENNDNQPLTITNIHFYQKPLVIVSQLTENEKYQVVVDSTYSKPTYDLKDFVAEKVVNLPEATVLNFRKVSSVDSTSSEKSFWQTKLFMWICIVLGGALVSYFAYGLLKDMNQE